MKLAECISIVCWARNTGRLAETDFGTVTCQIVVTAAAAAASLLTSTNCLPVCQTDVNHPTGKAGAKQERASELYNELVEYYEKLVSRDLVGQFCSLSACPLRFTGSGELEKRRESLIALT